MRRREPPAGAARSTADARPRTRRRVLTAAGAAGLGWCAGCLSSLPGNEPSPTPTPEPTPEPEDEFTVKMTGEPEYHYAMDVWYNPIGLYVPRDTTVTWVAENGAPHTATAFSDRIPEGAERFSSPAVQKGETFEHTFTVAGTYDYYCDVNYDKGMVGRVVCDQPGGPAEETPPPDWELPDSDQIVDDGLVAPTDVA